MKLIKAIIIITLAALVFPFIASAIEIKQIGNIVTSPSKVQLIQFYSLDNEMDDRAMRNMFVEQIGGNTKYCEHYIAVDNVVAWSSRGPVFDRGNIQSRIYEHQAIADRAGLRTKGYWDVIAYVEFTDQYKSVEFSTLDKKGRVVRLEQIYMWRGK
jgi:hypothetical protein